MRFIRQLSTVGAEGRLAGPPSREPRRDIRLQSSADHHPAEALAEADGAPGGTRTRIGPFRRRVLLQLSYERGLVVWEWLSWQDSNLRPSVPQTDALVPLSYRT